MLQLLQKRLTRLLLALGRLLLRAASFVIRLLTATNMRQFLTNDLTKGNFRRINQGNRQAIVSLNTRTLSTRRRQRTVDLNFTGIKDRSHIVRAGRQHTNLSSLTFLSRRFKGSPTLGILSFLSLQQ